jgi:hypothetical protein
MMVEKAELSALDVVDGVARACLQGRADAGTAAFMLCECQGESEQDPLGFYPVVSRGEDEVEVLALVCMGCSATGYFNDGKLVWTGTPDED